MKVDLFSILFFHPEVFREISSFQTKTCLKDKEDKLEDEGSIIFSIFLSTDTRQYIFGLFFEE